MVAGTKVRVHRCGDSSRPRVLLDPGGVVLPVATEGRLYALPEAEVLGQVGVVLDCDGAGGAVPVRLLESGGTFWFDRDELEVAEIVGVAVFGEAAFGEAVFADEEQP